MDSHFDAVVVGSGFGGSVMAYRLAEAGQRVCLLERGKAYPPGSFMRSPLKARESFWDPEHGLRGMYQYQSFRGIDALTASGLGGGSLIYANVLLRKDERWFVQEDVNDGGYEHWAVSRADLDPHYDRVEKMMHAQRYPFEHEPYSNTPKTIALKEAAEKNGYEWFLPNLAVTFANDGRPPVPGEAIEEEIPNLHGRTRVTCQLCGECDVGCNYGAKNTLDYTYLTHAAHHGAELRTNAHVRRIAPRPEGGYAVRYVDYDQEQGANGHPPAMVEVTAKRLILSAGTFGSTGLLLRNRSAFPRVSRKLGSRFCGNGDLLTIALNCTEVVDGKRTPRVIDPGYGPVITSTIRIPDTLDGGDGRGFYVQDAGYPQHLAWVLHTLGLPKALWRWRGRARQLVVNWAKGSPDPDVTAHIAELLRASELSTSGMPLLAMGRDIPDGHIFLRGNRLDVNWRRAESNAYFERLRRTSRELTHALGGRFTDNPIWFLKRVITVHPLGGAPMGRYPGEGVVDANGEVFGYPGLHVADGSVMPGPTGPNPSLTIAALADRFADHIIATERSRATMAAS